MSHWDFVSPADGQQDAPRPSGQAGTAYPPELPHDAGDGAWPAQDNWPADGGWSPDPRRSPAEDWPAAGDGSPSAGWPADGGWDDDEGWDDEEGTAPYPLTYERDDFAAAGPPSAAAAPEPWEPWPPAPRPDEIGPGEFGPGEFGPGEFADVHAGELAAGNPAGTAAGPGWQEGAGRRPGTDAAAAGWANGGPGLPGGGPADWAAGGGRRGIRRWLLPAGVAAAAAAAGAAAIVLTSGHPGARGAQGTSAPGSSPAAPRAAASTPAGTRPGTPSSPPSSPPSAAPLTMAQAQAVLAGYTAANNSANAQRNGTLLATVETGSSYAIDAGLYRQQGAGAAPYPPFSPVQATYYIPGNEPASGPRWFVAQVANAFTASPQKVTSYEYLLFTQSAGGAWQDTTEPYLPSPASAPRIKTGTDGLASAVSPDAASAAVPPGQLPADTAASLDSTGAGQVSIANPGALADRADQQLFQAKVPGGTVTDTHTAADGANGQEFALLTADGGALVFYTDAAKVTITPPAGSPLHLTVPGLYSSQQALTQATLAYLEQFAAYDPPAAAGGTPRIIADYSGITGKN